jgi:tRNA pseudouridine55 synthase
MVPLERLESAAADGVERLDSWLLGADAALVDVPAIEIDAEACQALRYGQAPLVGATDREGRVRVYDPSGQFIGIGHLDGSGGLRPARIFPG